MKEATVETKGSRRSVWLWVLLWLSVSGLIGSMAWGFFSYAGLQDRLAALPQTAVPGQVDVDVADSQSLTILYEDPTAVDMFVVRSSRANTLEAPPIQLTVTGPSGEAVDTRPYERDLRFDYDGSVLTAFATIETPAAGTYTIHASDGPAEARISVGDPVDFGLIANLVALVGLFVGSVIGIAVAAVLIAVKRGRRSSPDRIERPLVRV